MSLWDLIPTIPEVGSKVVCTTVGHDWKYYRDPNTKRRWRKCEMCEKEEWA